MKWLNSGWRGRGNTPAGVGQASDEALANFTPRAQQVLALARREADRFHHNFVGTEHLLLGLIRLGQGVAVNVLQKLGLDLETVRLEVEKQVGTGPEQKMLGNIPYTPRVKKVLALAQKEARALNHTYVGTEHILLGLLREGDGVAARVLNNLDVDIEQTWQEILKELDPNFSAVDVGTELSPSHSTPMPSKSEMPQKAESPKTRRELVDTSKRYDVYCTEQTQEVVVYRNALFKGAKSLLPKHQDDSLSEFVELEQADGQTIFIARYSVIKFCEPGVTPNSETARES
jgi:ATP-dependent Clp protease ATP-binding subunit ClpA